MEGLIMAKELFAGRVEAIAADYKAEVVDGKLKVSAESDLTVLIDKAAEAVPGESPIEALIVNLLKQGVKAL
jgi:hypothetical protein